MDKKLMKIVGIIMALIGIIMFFSNLSVTSFSFGRTGAMGLIMLLMGIDFVLMIVKPNKIFYIIFAILAACLIVSVILNMRIFMGRISFIRWLIMAALIFGGIGLTIKSN